MVLLPEGKRNRSVCRRAERAGYGVLYMIDRKHPILLVVESKQDIALAGEHLFRIGCDRVLDYFCQGMTSWQNVAL